MVIALGADPCPVIRSAKDIRLKRGAQCEPFTPDAWLGSRLPQEVAYATGVGRNRNAGSRLSNDYVARSVDGERISIICALRNERG